MPSNETEGSTGATSDRLIVPAPTSVARANRRVVLLNTPYPSPLIQQKRFDLLVALMSHVDILLEIANYFSPQTLLNLYSVSAPFHYIMNSHFTAFLMACAHTWAPHADIIFPWWCYRALCIDDPALRQVKPVKFEPSLSRDGSRTRSHALQAQAFLATVMAEEQRASRESAAQPTQEHNKPQVLIKPVPGFRWLKMVAYREAVATEIVGWMAVHGHRLPGEAAVEVIKVILQGVGRHCSSLTC